MKVVHTSTALSKKHTDDNDEDVNRNVEATYPNITLLVIKRPSLPITVIYSHDQGQDNDCVKDVGTFMLLKSLSHSAKSNALCYNIVTGKDGDLQSKHQLWCVLFRRVTDGRPACSDFIIFRRRVRSTCGSRNGCQSACSTCTKTGAESSVASQRRARERTEVASASSAPAPRTTRSRRRSGSERSSRIGRWQP